MTNNDDDRLTKPITLPRLCICARGKIYIKSIDLHIRYHEGQTRTINFAWRSYCKRGESSFLLEGGRCVMEQIDECVMWQVGK